MNSSKTLLLTLLICFFAFHCNAQNTSIEGEYLISNRKYEKIVIQPKKGNFLKIKLITKGGDETEGLFRPIKGSKLKAWEYQRLLNRSVIHRLELDEGLLKLYTADGIIGLEETDHKISVAISRSQKSLGGRHPLNFIAKGDFQKEIFN